MGRNDKDVCKSDRCCCQLISKCEEKPKPRNMCGGREERPEMNICDFLKSQPTPEWIKVNTGRPQHTGHNPCAEANNSKDRQRGQCGQAPPTSNSSGKNHTTYVHRPKPQPEWVRTSEQVCVSNNGGMHQSQHRRQNDLRSQPTICETEDRQLSQIIINFGTVLTSEKCKPDDSGQPTNSEVQEVPLEKKRRACKTTARPLPDRSTCCTRAPADRSTSTCPPVELSTSSGPPDRSSCTRAPDDRPIPTCPQPDRLTCTRAPVDRPIPTCSQPDRSTCTRELAEHSISPCPPPDRPTRTREPAERSTSTCPPTDRSSCTRAQADRSTSTYSPPDLSSYIRSPVDRSTRGSRAPVNRSNSNYPLAFSSSTGASADFSTCTHAPAGRSSFTLPQASSTFMRPSMDRLNFICPQADRNNRSISTRSQPDWSTSTRSLADRSSSVRPPNVRPPNVRSPNFRPSNVRPPNVRTYEMKSNTTTRGSRNRHKDNPSTQQRSHSKSGMKSNTMSCYCDNGNTDY